MEESKTYFLPGELVQVRHDIEFRPVMWIVEKQTRNMRNKDTGDIESVFLGIKCRWFDATGALQEAIFNTKDLERVE